MTVLFVTQNELEAHSELINSHTRDAASPFRIDINDTRYGAEFKYFLFFSLDHSIVQATFPNLTKESMLYNRYYWFSTFCRLYMSYHGYDAGLEQQEFELLEQADFDIDWELVKDTTDKVEREVSRRLASGEAQ